MTKSVFLADAGTEIDRALSSAIEDGRQFVVIVEGKNARTQTFTSSGVSPSYLIEVLRGIADEIAASPVEEVH